MPPPSGDLPDPGIEPESPASASGFLTTELPGSPKKMFNVFNYVTVTMPDIPHVTIWGKCHSASDFEQEWGIPGTPLPPRSLICPGYSFKHWLFLLKLSFLSREEMMC